jgi:cytochrome c oxidase subunit 4
MTSVKLYGIIFAVLAGLTTTQFVLESLVLDEFYWITLGIIMALSSIKAAAVAGWYMHLIDEPRAITYIAVAGVLGVIALTAGAAYSIT